VIYLSKIRVYQIAKELGLSSKDLVKKLIEMKFDVTNHMSALEDSDIAKIKEMYPVKKEEAKATDKKTDEPKKDAGEDAAKKGRVKKKKEAHKPQAIVKKPPRSMEKKVKKRKKKIKHKEEEIEEVEIMAYVPEFTEEGALLVHELLTVGDFARGLDKSPNEVIMRLMQLGTMATINQDIDFDTMEVIAGEFEMTIELKVVEEEEEGIFIEDFEDEEDDLEFRAPIVTVMGHVDHGKTSLLDAIRSTVVTDGEAGGITQHIGASEVEINEQKIVFLDTPGHEAFTTLRARGAQVTDIAILVVAADDGVMPQTIEAIDHAKAANVPIIVAVNKIDKANANPDRVKQELSDHGLLVEDWGGDIICAPVSALKGEGIDHLLEMVLLVAEMGELRANPDRVANGTIIESNLESGRGPVATVIVQNGTLSIGDSFVAGSTFGKVKALYDHRGKRIQEAGPSTSVLLVGANGVPMAGDRFYVTGDERRARHLAEKQGIKERNRAMAASGTHVSLEDLFQKIQEGEIQDLNIIIKADAHGSVEALKQSFAKIVSDEVRIKMIHSAVGAITESDILLASASNAIIIGFNVRPSTVLERLAMDEGVELKTYRIIYEAIQDVEKAMTGMLAPEFREVVQGKVEVRATFKVPNIGTIAGAYVLTGKVTRNSGVRLVREGIVIFEGKISSLKRFKDDAKEVKSGFECGIGIESYNDLREGDIIESFIIEEIARTSLN